MTVWLEIAGKKTRVDLPEGLAGLGDGVDLVCFVDGREVAVHAAQVGEGVLSLIAGGRQTRFVLDGDEVVVGGRRVAFSGYDPRSLQARRGVGEGLEGPRAVKAPMPGRVVRVAVSAGQEVGQGEAIVVIEAMKMQNELRSPKAGRVGGVAVQVGDAVQQGDVLAVIE